MREIERERETEREREGKRERKKERERERKREKQREREKNRERVYSDLLCSTLLSPSMRENNCTASISYLYSQHQMS